MQGRAILPMPTPCVESKAFEKRRRVGELHSECGARQNTERRSCQWFWSRYCWWEPISRDEIVSVLDLTAARNKILEKEVKILAKRVSRHLPLSLFGLLNSLFSLTRLEALKDGRHMQDLLQTHSLQSTQNAASPRKDVRTLPLTTPFGYTHDLSSVQAFGL
jgi:hypothetical protein